MVHGEERDAQVLRVGLERPKDRDRNRRTRVTHRSHRLVLRGEVRLQEQGVARWVDAEDFLVLRADAVLVPGNGGQDGLIGEPIGAWSVHLENRCVGIAAEFLCEPGGERGLQEFGITICEVGHGRMLRIVHLTCTEPSPVSPPSRSLATMTLVPSGARSRGNAMAVKSYDKLYIGGKWVAPLGTDVISVINPATEEVIATVPDGTIGDIEAAVAAAREAFDHGPWPKMAPAERGAVVAKVAELLMGEMTEMAELITTEMGAPMLFSQMGQVAAPFMVLNYYAGAPLQGRRPRRRRRHHPVERAAVLGRGQARPRPRGWLHRGAEARSGDAARRLPVG